MKALAGKKILITRALAQAERTGQDVARRGGTPVLFPCLEMQCMPDSIKAGLALLSDVDTHVLFTSSNGVRCVSGVLGSAFAESLRQCRLAATGEKTASALRKLGINNLLLPETASQEGLLSAYMKNPLPRRLVFFRAEEGRNVLPDALQQQGVEVHVIPAYHMVCPQDDATDIRQALQLGQIDAVLLGSAKTVRHYVQRIGDPDLAGSAILAAISPAVAASASELGLEVQAIAKQASFPSMLDALENYFQQQDGGEKEGVHAQ